MSKTYYPKITTGFTVYRRGDMFPVSEKTHLRDKDALIVLPPANTTADTAFEIWAEGDTKRAYGVGWDPAYTLMYAQINLVKDRLQLVAESFRKAL